MSFVVMAGTDSKNLASSTRKVSCAIFPELTRISTRKRYRRGVWQDSARFARSPCRWCGATRDSACPTGISKFVAIGLNYVDHAHEAGLQIPPSRWSS